jgi:hypothetical protein
VPSDQQRARCEQGRGKGVDIMQATEWTVSIFIEEDGIDVTRAQAVLRSGDRVELRGSGHARRNPIDRPVNEIGDELAVSRALADLSHRLLDAAMGDIEQLAGAR